MGETLFRFKEFQVQQEKSAMKINTDGVLLGAWVNCDGVESILDIGTGSGVIAMMLAQRSAAKKIVGVEIDKESVLEAAQNMKECQWSTRLQAVHDSIQDYAKTNRSEFDLLVSNPPFFSGGTLSSTQQRSLVKHTVKLSHNDLLRSAFSLLKPDGEFCVVLPYIEGLRLVELAEQSRLYLNRICEVHSFKDSPVERLLLAFKKSKESLLKESLVIRANKDEFTEAYCALTRDFYLKM